MGIGIKRLKRRSHWFSALWQLQQCKGQLKALRLKTGQYSASCVHTTIFFQINLCKFLPNAFFRRVFNVLLKWVLFTNRYDLKYHDMLEFFAPWVASVKFKSDVQRALCKCWDLNPQTTDLVFWVIEKQRVKKRYMLCLNQGFRSCLA